MALTQVDVSQIAANAASFEALRSVVPTKEGQLAYLEYDSVPPCPFHSDRLSK